MTKREEVVASKHENDLAILATVSLILAVLVCLALIISGCVKLDSYSGKEEGWLRIAVGFGVAMSGVIAWAVLKAVAELLVLFKNKPECVDPIAKLPHTESKGPLYPLPSEHKSE